MAKKYIYQAMLLLVSIIILLIDITLRYDYDLYLLYLLPILLGFNSHLNKRYFFSVTLLNTVFILSKFIIPPFEVPGTSTFNRLIFIPLMWIVAYIQTERVKALSNSKKTQEQLQSLADSMPQMVFTTGADGMTDYINKKWSEFTGLDHKDVVGSGWLDIFHPDDRSAASEAWMNSVKTGEKYEISARLKSSDGNYYWHLNRAIPEKDGNGKISKWFGTSTDISELKRLEEQVNIFAKRFQRMTDSNIFGIVISDSNGYITEANDYYLKLTGFSRKEIESFGLRWQDLTPPEYLALDYNSNEMLTESGISTPYEKQYLLRNGERKWIMIASTLLPGSEKLYLSFILDINDRKLQEQKLQETLTNLERSNNELEQFAYVASHDLQEPLRMISNYLGLLVKNYGDRFDERAEGYVKVAVDSAKRMSNLIRDLLTFSRLNSGQQTFVKIDLNKLIQGVIDDLKTLIEENNATISVDEMPEIAADETQIRQLFQNLISNAIKFRGGKSPKIEVKVQKKENEWLFSIKDNGIGIEADYYEKIFLIFQRLNEREKYQGTGIGLAVCKKIVERHNGRIWVESKLNEGSTFLFTIAF